MALSKEEVKQLADLARLELSDEEIAKAEKELDAILEFVDRLKKVKTEGVEPQTMPAKSSGWREDVVMPSDELARELILSNFPSRRDDLLSVPAVFETPKGKNITPL